MSSEPRRVLCTAGWIAILALLVVPSASAMPMNVTGSLVVRMTGTDAVSIPAVGSLGFTGVAEVSGPANSIVWASTAITVTSLDSMQTSTSSLVLKPIDGPVVRGLGNFVSAAPGFMPANFAASGAGANFGGSAPLSLLWLTPALSTGTGTPTPFVYVSLGLVGRLGPALSTTVNLSGVILTLGDGGPWQTGVVSFTLPTPSGGAKTFVATGTDSRTASGAGQLSLVTPIRINSSTNPGAGIGGFATYTLQFSLIPEPSTAVLVAGALACLAVARRRLRTSRTRANSS